MCRSTLRTASRISRDLETWQTQAPGEVLGGRLRHWGRATLELRRVRKGSARIPLRGNPGRASSGKAPGKEFREPDSGTTRLSSPKTIEKLITPFTLVGISADDLLDRIVMLPYFAGWKQNLCTNKFGSNQSSLHLHSEPMDVDQ
ncbi:hypothetical protein NDU88_009723 [Pleurodeles waltl]|uniref:Uncharacterized protein n=1 Tax=Pleurodeles waltl TaxID=8319 RepID=A0AAV7QSE7_PLEWA|nr:hypothetical protein NDU88_009723 [Pleurodeles waltl]